MTATRIASPSDVLLDSGAHLVDVKTFSDRLVKESSPAVV